MSWLLFHVTAKDCGACQLFRSRWEGIKTNLKTVFGNKLEIDEIEYEKKSISQLDTSKYPSDLRRFIGWFPTLILIPMSEYEKVKRGELKFLPAVVYNGRMSDSKPFIIEQVPKDKKQPLLDANILSWVRAEMERGPAPQAPTITSLQSPVVQTPPAEEKDDVCTRLRLKSRFH